MDNISENPIDPKTLASIKACAKNAMNGLGIAEKDLPPKEVVAALDEFVYQWQKGKRPPEKILSQDGAALILGSLWGEQLSQRFGWDWAKITFHDHGNSVAHGIFSQDRSLAVYPRHFLTGCLQNPRVDCTIALSYNMLDAGKIGQTTPGQYLNLMEGVRRIVPRQ